MPWNREKHHGMMHNAARCRGMKTNTAAGGKCHHDMKNGSGKDNAKP